VINKGQAVDALIDIYNGAEWNREGALEYIRAKKWTNTVEQVDRVLRGWQDEKSRKPDAKS